MPIADSALQRLRDSFVSTDASQADGAPALRLSATGNQTFSTLTVTGQILAADGTAAAPSYSFSTADTQNSGIYRAGTDDIRVAINGSDHIRFVAGGPTIAAAEALKWGSSGVGSADLSLFRDKAATLALRNGTTAQNLRIYNTFTTVDTSGEWGSINFTNAANVFTIQTNAGSAAGTVRAIVIQPATQVQTGTGGAGVTVTAGAGLGVATGGALNLNGGAAGTTGSGGAIGLTSGAGGTSAGNSGAITFANGTVSSTTGATGGNGGVITLTGATGGASTNASGTGGVGSTYTVTGGNGGTASGATSSTGGLGGGITLTAGNGGTITGTTTAIGGAGGAITITAGNGATATTGSANTAGAGGNVIITAGNAGASGGNVHGGRIDLITGSLTGTGLKPLVNIDAAGSVPTTAVMPTTGMLGFKYNAGGTLVAYVNDGGAIKSLSLGSPA